MSNPNDAADCVMAVMGSGGVGKSALTLRLVTDNFTPGHEPTIEDTYRMALNVDGKTSNLDILDTAGQDQFNAMQDQWIRSAHGFLLVYSIDSQASFNELKAMYEKILRVKEVRTGAPVVLVGNKCDLTDNRAVSAESGAALAAEWGCKFYETSAKDKINNVVCFYDVVRAARNRDGPKETKPKRKGKCTIL